MKNSKLVQLKNVDLSNAEEKRNYNKDLFDIVAPQYRRITGLLSFGQDSGWKRKMMDMLPTVDSPRCLDIACGTGDITKALAEKYPKGDVIGFDLNEKMVAEASLANEHQAIEFVIGDMCNMDLESDQYDIVTGGYALRNAPDLSMALAEIYRVMKSGATALFLDFSKPKNSFAAACQIALLKFWGNLWGLIFHGKPEVYGYIGESLKRFPHRELLQENLKEAGFTKIRSRLLLFGFLELIYFEKA